MGERPRFGRYRKDPRGCCRWADVRIVAIFRLDRMTTTRRVWRLSYLLPEFAPGLKASASRCPVTRMQAFTSITCPFETPSAL